MQKIEDIKTPKNVRDFRDNLKKYCLGHKNNIFIYKKTNNIQVCVDINKLSKMSDIFKFIKDESKLNSISRSFDIVLMCDISHINLKNLVMNNEDVIRALKEVYLFNNQDKLERSNFLISTPIAIDKIISGIKVINEIDTQPWRTALDDQTLASLYNHLFGKYFDTVTYTKKIFNLSKYN